MMFCLFGLRQEFGFPINCPIVMDSEGMASRIMDKHLGIMEYIQILSKANFAIDKRIG